MQRVRRKVEEPLLDGATSHASVAVEIVAKKLMMLLLVNVLLVGRTEQRLEDATDRMW